MIRNFYKKFNLIYCNKVIFIILFICSLFNFIFSFKVFLLINFILLIHYVSIIYFIKYENNKYFPILPLITIFFFLTYTLSFLISKKIFFYQFFDENIISKSIFILIFGLCSLLFGYIFLDKFIDIRKKKIFYFNYLKKKHDIFIFIVCLILACLVYYNFTCTSFLNLSFIKQIKEPLILFTFGLFLTLILKRKTKRWLFYILLVILLSVILILEVSAGVTLFVFFLFLFLFSLYFYLTKKIPIFSLILILLLSIFFHTSKYKLRQIVWHSEKNLSCIEKVIIFKSIVFSFNYINNEKSYITHNNSDRNKFRLFHSINSLNIISKLTPNTVPFFKGGSYKAIYAKFIPRDFWKNKPLDEQGNFWGHRYLVLNPEDKTTSWNFPVLNEFYANFGMLGVIFGMFFLGLFTKLLLLKLWTKNSSNIEILASSVIVYNLFFLENNLSQILGKIINQFIFFNIFFFILYLLIKFISKYFKSFSP
jgi:hypothetical protein